MKLHKDVTNKRTIKRFQTLEEDFRKVHGDKYDYSKVIYKGATSEVTITCPIHGNFKKRPHDHLKGSGCSKCSGKYRPSTNEWIEEPRKVHGDKYDYSKVIYKGRDKDVIITCPIHGDFPQTPKSHIETKYGCPECAKEHNKWQIYQAR